MTDITGSIVFVTGANGGLGAEFVRQALELGATKVYATARSPRHWEDERIVPIALDVTDPASIAAAAEIAQDVTILINNAGVSGGRSLLTMPINEVRAVYETNVFGPIEIVQAFAPILAANGGGAVVDIHSALSWLATPGAYSSTKAALWSVTNTLRIELAPHGTQVVGVHLGYTDTPLIAALDVPKGDPRDVVAEVYEGVRAGALEVLADDTSRSVKQAISQPVEVLYPQFAARV